MNRRKFLTYASCSCCGFILNSCASAPITERRQFKIVPEERLNAQAADIYEKVNHDKQMRMESLKNLKSLKKN